MSIQPGERGKMWTLKCEVLKWPSMERAEGRGGGEDEDGG
jgi:hypothetical protein